MSNFKRDLRDIIILIIVFITLVYALDLDAADFDIKEYIYTEHQWRYPGQSDTAWKPLTVITKGKIDISDYLYTHRGIVEQRYWSKVVDTKGVEHWIDTRLTVGE